MGTGASALRRQQPQSYSITVDPGDTVDDQGASAGFVDEQPSTSRNDAPAFVDDQPLISRNADEAQRIATARANGLTGNRLQDEGMYESAGNNSAFVSSDPTESYPSHLALKKMQENESAFEDSSATGQRSVRLDSDDEWIGRSAHGVAADVTVKKKDQTRRRRDEIAENKQFEDRPRYDAYKDLVAWKVFCRADPFRGLTEEWLEGRGQVDKSTDPPPELIAAVGKASASAVAHAFKSRDASINAATVAEAEEDDVIETEEERVEREALDEEARAATEWKDAERLRMEELMKDKCDGWKTWLRGRSLRSEFKVQPQLSAKEIKKQQFIRDMGGKAGSEKARPVKVLNQSWIRAPIDAQRPQGSNEVVRGEMVCWKSEFVEHALRDAAVLGLAMPVVSAETARSWARKDWSMIETFYSHVEATDLDGNRQLWSPMFVAFLWEYWQRSKLGDLVCKSEAELTEDARAEGIHHELFRGKPVEWPQPIPKPQKFKVPTEFLQRAGKPDLPPFPYRLAHRKIFKEDALERSLHDHLKGTEAWDALLGKSDLLHSAARAALRSERYEVVKDTMKEEVAFRRMHADDGYDSSSASFGE